jgi:carbamoyl-phosphate synthase large subunit
MQTIETYTRRIAQELGVVGLMNMQYAIADNRVYVLEANPRASRTVPLVSKVCNLSMARIATEIMLSGETGKPSPVPGLKTATIPYYGVKEAVFPFNMFPEVDPVLGPEMRSTGEVLGLSKAFGEAWFKAQEATQSPLPLSGTVLMSVVDSDKQHALEAARLFVAAGFTIVATGGTCQFLNDKGVAASPINKLYEGRPNILDAISNGEIQLVINTPIGKRSQHDDSYIRKAAIRKKIPYITTMALASAKGIASMAAGKGEKSVPFSLQEYHRML